MPFSNETVNRDSLCVETGDILNVTGITDSLFCFVQYLWLAHEPQFQGGCTPWTHLDWSLMICVHIPDQGWSPDLTLLVTP